MRAKVLSRRGSEKYEESMRKMIDFDRFWAAGTLVFVSLYVQEHDFHIFRDFDGKKPAHVINIDGKRLLKLP